MGIKFPGKEAMMAFWNKSKRPDPATIPQPSAGGKAATPDPALAPATKAPAQAASGAGTGSSGAASSSAKPAASATPVPVKAQVVNPVAQAARQGFFPYGAVGATGADGRQFICVPTSKEEKDYAWGVVDDLLRGKDPRRPHRLVRYELMVQVKNGGKTSYVTWKEAVATLKKLAADSGMDLPAPATSSCRRGEVWADEDEIVVPPTKTDEEAKWLNDRFADLHDKRAAATAAGA